MFGFHGQAVRSNRHARKMTNCTYLAQSQMEQLLALPWNSSDGVHDDLIDSDGDSDPTSSASPWEFLEQPSGGSQPSAVNASGNTDTTYGQTEYYLTWDLKDQDSDQTWIRMRVRCQYYDDTFNQWKGTTVSSFRFQDNQ